jgi:hypothetical protein
LGSPAAYQATARTPDIVRRYFVALPDPADKSAGLGFTAFGGGSIVMGWFLPFMFAASSNSSSGSTSGSSTDAFASLLLGTLVFLGGNLVGWPLLAYGLRRLFLFQRQSGARTGAPTDAEMDAWFNRDVEGIKAYGLKELNLPADRFVREPLVVVGPSLPTDYAIGFDGVPRFASYEAAVVCITDTSVGVFNCLLSSLSGGIMLETTNEFAFADVISIATFNDRTAAHGGGTTDGRTRRMVGSIRMNYLTPADVSIRQEFRISLTSGENVAVNVGCHVNGANFTNENFRSYVRNVVKALRANLREIKAA